MYQEDALRKYIEKTRLVEITPYFKMRLSKELYQKYEKGLYDTALESLKENIEEIRDLNITYPSNSKPVFYLYVVPDENLVELLDYTDKNAKSGGRPVPCFDLDGYNMAFGLSNNLMENASAESLMQKSNTLHELAHLVHSNFFSKDAYICEGYADLVVFYVMGFEDLIPLYKDTLESLSDYYSPKKLIEMGNSGEFYREKTLLPKTSCSFVKAYLSSYRFLKYIIQKLEKKYNLNKEDALQKLSEIIRSSRCYEAYLVYDLAVVLDLDKDKLLEGVYDE